MHKLPAPLPFTESPKKKVERFVRMEPSVNRDAVLILRDGKTLRLSRTYRSRLEDLLR
jgi:hypothetical protein